MFGSLRHATPVALGLFASLLAPWLTTPASAQPVISGAVLPNARSVPVGEPATFFVTMVNSGDQEAINCGPDLRNPDPNIALRRFELDSEGAIAGDFFDPISIPAGESRNILLELTASADTTGAIALRFGCNNGAAAYLPAINDVVLTSLSAGPTWDVIAVSATTTNDGVIDIAGPRRRGLMTVAATHILPDGDSAGPAAPMRVTPRAGDFTSELDLEVCELDENSLCIGDRAPFLDIDMAQGEPRFFAVFARSAPNAGLPFMPDFLRVSLDFADRTGPGYVRASTSAAIRSPAPASAPDNAAGIYRIRMLPGGGGGGDNYFGWLYVDADGQTVGTIFDNRFFGTQHRIFRLHDPVQPGADGVIPVLRTTHDILSVSGGTLDADIRLRFTPGTGVAGQFLPYESAKPELDGAAFFGAGGQPVGGVAMTRAYAGTDSLDASDLDGVWTVFDTFNGVVTGSMSIFGSNVSASFRPYSDGASVCTFSATLDRPATGRVLGLDSVSMSGSACSGLTAQFEGLAALHEIDVIDAQGMQVLLYPEDSESPDRPVIAFGFSAQRR